MRDTLKRSMTAVERSIPVNKFIFITETGKPIGQLRNLGVSRATTDIVAVIDDDVIVNRLWFKECLSFLKNNDDVIAVIGNTHEGPTLGCMLCKRKEFLAGGGFPYLDSDILNNKKVVTLNQVFVDHVVTPLQIIRHTLHWLGHGFATDYKFGWYNDPRECVRLFFFYLKRKRPVNSLQYVLWFAKAIYVYPLRLID
jgi:glycosyltransferase involved in cell wall biosynthesis